jgi:hypothetical protein
MRISLNLLSKRQNSYIVLILKKITTIKTIIFRSIYSIHVLMSFTVKLWGYKKFESYVSNIGS